MIYEDLAKMVDHSLLQPNLTEQDIINGCEIAIKYNVNLVMVRPFDVPMATKITEGVDVGVASTVGFPHGVNLSKIKYHEANFAIINGVKVLVKAAGGIRSLDSVLEYIEAGASRFGLTATSNILDDFISRNNK